MAEDEKEIKCSCIVCGVDDGELSLEVQVLKAEGAEPEARKIVFCICCMRGIMGAMIRAVTQDPNLGGALGIGVAPAKPPSRIVLPSRRRNN